MQTAYIPLIIVGTALVASVISVRLGITVAVVEIVLGVAVGNAFNVDATEWLDFLAGLGSVLLIFLAGLEVSPGLLRQTLKSSLLMGGLAFALPFAAAFSYCFWVAGWSFRAAEIGGAALSTTSVAVIYAILAESGQERTELGKVLMAAAFVTDLVTTIVLSVLFAQASWWTLLFVFGSAALIVVSPWLFRRFIARYKGRTHEAEVRLVFVLLFACMLLAQLGKSHAILPVFVLGFVLSKDFQKNTELRMKLRVLAFGLLTPFFFIKAGMAVSLGAVATSIGLVAILFAIQVGAKIAAVYPLARKYLCPHGFYASLLMSTGLTFGTLAAFFGLESGFIDDRQFSVLVTTVIATAVIPTIVAQRWFHPDRCARPGASDVVPERGMSEKVRLGECPSAGESSHGVARSTSICWPPGEFGE